MVIYSSQVTSTKHLNSFVSHFIMGECKESNCDFMDLILLVWGVIGAWEDYALLAVPEELQVS